MANIKQLEDICTTPDLAFTEDSFWQFCVCVCVCVCICVWWGEEGSTQLSRE